MKRAIISDIHANLEALTAVLEDIRLQGVHEIYCLGDIVGYGPNPCECLQRVMELPCVILGNHDAALIEDPKEEHSESVLASVNWTKQQLHDRIGEAAFEFIRSLPRSCQRSDVMFVHGSPRDPTYEYVFRMDSHNTTKMAELFRRFDRVCFHGHTHVPGVMTPEAFTRPSECENVFQLGTIPALINVGSVGQPRDGDPQACYVIYSDETVTFHRVPYPIDVTRQKILAIPELDSSFGDRLLRGE
jgi:diadenosine tetraphosphatase ApaH/serine/threonine PP2A family protein phosphatase